MQKRTREILALVLLGLLALVAAIAMGYYILIGHNWNVAASNIDDSIGQMEGYTIFLYEGTNPSPEMEERLSDAQPMLDDENRGKATRDWNAKPREPLTSKEAAESYRDKGAVVFTLDSSDLDYYADPFVVQKNGMRVGLFSAFEPFRKTVVRTAVRNLERRETNYIVALTDDVDLCEAGIGGISIIICNDDEGESPDGEYRGSSYCTGVPYIGEVEAIIMSPSGVLSSKTLTEL